MRMTSRDVRLVKDIALSHLLSRDQIIELRYFSSVTRANTRLRELAKFGFVRTLTTPFFGQQLYMAGRRAETIVGERISSLLRGRAESPRFVRHALSVTNVRLKLLSKGATEWRFEQQLGVSFQFAGKDFEVRPDGLAVTENGLIAVEADLGHVAPQKFKEKLMAYDAFVSSGVCRETWKSDGFRLLIVTSGPLRASRLSRLVLPGQLFETAFHDTSELGIQFPGAWS